MVLTSHYTSLKRTAEELRLTETELAEIMQIATDAGTEDVRKEFPELVPVAVSINAHGERFRAPTAIILAYQFSYVGMEVPLLRRVYVERESKKAHVGYAD